MTWFLNPNPWARSFAHFLIWANIGAAIVFYFAGPIHAAMTRENSLLTVELRLATLIVNAVAALAIVRNRRLLGVLILALIGTVVLLDHMQKNDFFLLNLLVSYWDVWILLLLEGLFFLKGNVPRSN
jgi:hypothetical protein